MNFDKNIRRVQKVDAQKSAGRIHTLAVGVLLVLISAGFAFAGVGPGLWGRGGSSGTSYTDAQAAAATGWSSNGSTTSTAQPVSVGARISSTVASSATAYVTTAGAYSCFDAAETACWRVTGGNGSGALAFYGSTVSSANWAVGASNSVGMIAFTATAPTVTSACTSPTITYGTSTSFQMDVGSSCATGTLVLALPNLGGNGWECHGYSKTAGRAILQSGDTSTSATLTHYTTLGMVASNFTDGEDLVISCTGR